MLQVLFVYILAPGKVIYDFVSIVCFISILYYEFA